MIYLKIIPFTDTSFRNENVLKWENFFYGSETELVERRKLIDKLIGFIMT